MSARIGLSKKRRFDIFKRDLFTCQYCGSHPPGIILHVDHIIAVANGGDNDEENLITSCEGCNLGKGARPLSTAPEALAEKAIRIAEAEEQLAGYVSILDARKERIEADVWRVVESLTGDNEILTDRFISIKRFVERLGVHEVIEAAEVGRSRFRYSELKAFKYFCGVCWNKIKVNEGV